jgi:MFS family permease
MDMTTMMLIGIIPTTLIVLGGLLVMKAGKEETAERRFLLYLVSVSIVMLLTVVVADLFSTEMNRMPGITASSIISTAILGVLALILLHLPALKGLPRHQWLPYLALTVLLIGLLAIYAQNTYSMAYYVLPAALGLALIWAAANRWQGLAIILAGFCLFYFVLSNSLAYASWLEQRIYTMPAWLRFPYGILIFAMPGIAVALSAVLVHTGLKRLWRIPNGSVQASVAMDAPGRPDERGDSPFTSENPPVISLTPVKRPGSRLSGALRLALAFTILGALAYTIFWSSVWDQTSDGMGGLFYMMPAVLVGVGAGAVMGINAKSWFRSSGFVFAVTVPALMIWAFNSGWQLPFAGITEDRAARIQTAIENFYTRTGRYPSTLNELAPRNLLYVPQPVMFRGEGWCYQGGVDYYRLGAFYHEYFSTPVSLKIYFQAGSPPETGWACAERLAYMKQRYGPPDFVEFGGSNPNIPTPVPLAKSQVTGEKISAKPWGEAESLSVGDWSPSSRYLVFSFVGSGVVDANPVKYMQLGFLDPPMGKITNTPPDYPAVSSLRQYEAWLPDGRLLLVLEDGTMDAFTSPMKVEHLASNYADKFTSIPAVEKKSSRLLLKSVDSYWILDGKTMEAKLIPGVAPNPYELHWDNYSWLPGGEKLVISRLNGRDETQGTTLFIIDGATAQVLASQTIKEAYKQSSPWVDFVGPDQVVINGSGKFDLYDFSSTPVMVTDVLKDLFGLDLRFPDDASSSFSQIDASGKFYHLGVHANHPRNHSVYLYHSETGKVEVLDPTADPILFLPDGKCIYLPAMQSDATYKDEFELIWVDQPEKPHAQLTLQGHNQRDYPTLAMACFEKSSRIAFASAQGVSLVSIPDGKLLRFWDLGGARNVSLTLSPDEKYLVAMTDTAIYPLELP